MNIIDTPDDTSKQIIHLHADGITTVMRYLTANMASLKLVSVSEAKLLAAANIRLGLVYEMGGGAPGQMPLNALYGHRDGQFAASYAPKVGAPAGACIYFAADNDFANSEIDSNVLPYFEEVAEALADSGFDVGVYGSGLVCKRVIASGYAKKSWLSGSLGWTNSRLYLATRPAELVLVQDKMETRLANMDVDTNYALGDFGDFLPFATEMV